MAENAPADMGIGKRVTILNTIGVQGDKSDGQSLRGQNVNNFPAASLFYVRDSNRMYRLKKSLAVAIAEDTGGMANVINGLGSSAANGRFVALVQMGTGTLTGGEGTSTVDIAGWDVNPAGQFHVSYSTLSGGVGALMAESISETTVRVTSSSGSDGSIVFVTYYQLPGAE
jgi:hypothetical protein